MTKAKFITILDDSREIRELIAGALEAEGFETRSFETGAEFERALRTLEPDVCIVDLGLPDREGLTLVNAVATSSNAAVLIVSGRSNTQDKIAGLELGADDYITKPFEVIEVVARVKALLRRSKNTAGATTEKIFRFSGWIADLEQHLLMSPDKNTVRLSYGEAQVLRIFLNSPNRLVTRDKILEQLDEDQSDNFDRAIDVRVSRLRSKLQDDPNNPKIIKTIYGAGYIFIADLNG
jgi:DNA-binding response OmpR family regulator